MWPLKMSYSYYIHPAAYKVYILWLNLPCRFYVQHTVWPQWLQYDHYLQSHQVQIQAAIATGSDHSPKAGNPGQPVSPHLKTR